MFTYIDFIGYLGGVLGSVRLVPQIVKSIKTKSTEDISYGMLGLSMTSQLCTIFYTAHIHATPLLVPVTISFGFTVVMTGMKYIFDSRPSVVQASIEASPLVGVDLETVM